MTPKDTRPAAAPASAIEQMTAHLPEMFLALTRMQATIFDAAMRQNIEWLDFLKSRCERDRELAARIAKASDPDDLSHLWNEFWRKAADDYATEPGHLSRIGQAAVGTALSEARHDAGEIMHPVRSTAV